MIVSESLWWNFCFLERGGRKEKKKKKEKREKYLSDCVRDVNEKGFPHPPTPRRGEKRKLGFDPSPGSSIGDRTGRFHRGTITRDEG